jgi:hypothetical protein
MQGQCGVQLSGVTRVGQPRGADSKAAANERRTVRSHYAWRGLVGDLVLLRPLQTEHNLVAVRYPIDQAGHVRRRRVIDTR